MSDSELLSPYFEAFVREQIESGRYSSSSEVIRAGLRALQERELILKFDELKKVASENMSRWE